MGCRIVAAASAALLLAVGARSASPEPSGLTEADRKAFAWFDGIGLPSCAGKPYVRVRWVREGTSEETLRRQDLWVVDGFVVAERDGAMTLLDGDLWPRKVPRTPAPSWTGGVSNLDLRRTAAAATARLKAIRSDPGAVEGMEDLYPGIRIRFGDEAQSLAFARHLAENGLEREARALLDAARLLPPAPGTTEGTSFDEIVAAQMAESVIWRIHFDFADPDVPRAQLLDRLRRWRASFPKSPHVARADDLLLVLPEVVEEEARAKPSDANLDSLVPGEQAKELVRRLQDQGGDVFQDRDGRVSIQLGGTGTPARRLVALGRDAAPALVEAVTDRRTTRAVLFVRETSFRRIVVARVGDFARVVLEEIAGESFWDPPDDKPSMFQHGAAAEVQARCREWLQGEGAR